VRFRHDVAARTPEGATAFNTSRCDSDEERPGNPRSDDLLSIPAGAIQTLDEFRSDRAEKAFNTSRCDSDLLEAAEACQHHALSIPAGAIQTAQFPLRITSPSPFQYQQVRFRRLVARPAEHSWHTFNTSRCDSDWASQTSVQCVSYLSIPAGAIQTKKGRAILEAMTSFQYQQVRFRPSGSG